MMGSTIAITTGNIWSIRTPTERAKKPTQELRGAGLRQQTNTQYAKPSSGGSTRNHLQPITKVVKPGKGPGGLSPTVTNGSQSNTHRSQQPVLRKARIAR